MVEFLMNNRNSDIAGRLGSLIKLNRMRLNMTQFQLSEDICSQAMISSIERGIDVPNVILFTKICTRLKIKTTDQFLAHAINIHSFENLSDEIFELCKQHKYEKMITLMDASDVLDRLVSDQDIQTYYYYYSCALYQLKSHMKDAIKYLKLAAHVSMNQPYQPKSEIEILVVNALGVLYLELGYDKNAATLFEVAYQQYMAGDVFSENGNVVLYYYGNHLYRMGKYEQALGVFLHGFDDVIMKQSYFMLAEYALGIARCYDKLGNEEKSDDYHNRHMVMSDIANIKNRHKNN